jgi:hypothetical protein
VTFKLHGKLITVHSRKITINTLKDAVEVENILGIEAPPFGRGYSLRVVGLNAHRRRRRRRHPGVFCQRSVV